LKISNFVPLTESYDPDCDEALVSELLQFLNCSLKDLYVVGDDNDELETEGVAFYLSDYFENFFISESDDKYIGFYERDGNRIAETTDHGYTNFYVAKKTIKNIPPIKGGNYKKAKDAFWESWRNNK